MNNVDIINFLKLLRDSCNLSSYIFHNGGCFKLYQMLKIFNPLAEAWYDGIEGHIYTKINNHFYDIDGEQEPQEHWYRLSIEPAIEKSAENWTCVLTCN